MAKVLLNGIIDTFFKLYLCLYVPTLGKASIIKSHPNDCNRVNCSLLLSICPAPPSYRVAQVDAPPTRPCQSDPCANQQDKVPILSLVLQLGPVSLSLFSHTHPLLQPNRLTHSPLNTQAHSSLSSDHTVHSVSVRFPLNKYLQSPHYVPRGGTSK